MNFLNTNSQNEDEIALAYKSNDKVIITNFPDFNTPIYTIQENYESFEITNNGLKINLLKYQEINFSNIVKIKFHINTKQLNVVSTGNIAFPHLKNTKCFLFKLRDSSNTIKKYSYIKSNENANNFASDLNNISFNFGDIIELISFSIKEIEIKNFSTLGQNIFIEKRFSNSEVPQEFFTITAQGLQTYTPSISPPTATLLNTIKINTINNSKLLSINFNILDKVFQTFSFSTLADSSSKYNYVIIKLYDTNNNLIINSSIPSNNLPSYIETGLRVKIFDFNYILDLTYDYRARSNILITNINGSDHIPKHFNERYKITTNGLEFIPIFLPNIITINNLNYNPVIFIEFNILEKTLKGTSVNNIADSSTAYDYVTISLYHLTDNTLSSPFFSTTLMSNEVSTSFSTTLSNAYFIEDCILELICNDKALNKIDISNFPNSAQIYTINTNKKYFKITNKKLTEFIPTSILEYNSIRLIAPKNIHINALNIIFDPKSKKIKATATYDQIASAHSGQSIFSYKLYDKNGTLKKEDSITGRGLFYPNSGVATDLANNLNDTPFDYGYTFEIYSLYRQSSTSGRTRLFINNLPFKTNEYSLFSYTETVNITPLGMTLQSNSPLGNTPILKDIITLHRSTSSATILLQIYFDIKSLKLLVSSSGFQTKYSPSDPDYFIFILKNKTGKQKAIARINGDTNADAFADALNNVTFEFGDTITPQCPKLNKVRILNYLTYNNKYTLGTKDEFFTITKSGLLSSLNILKNEITFLGLSDDLIATISFDIGSKKLIVKSTEIKANSNFKDKEYFSIVLKDNFNNTIKNSSVKGNESADNFAKTLNETPFQYGYNITVHFTENNKFLVSNYINNGDIYKSPDNLPKTFTITSTSLILTS